MPKGLLIGPFGARDGWTGSSRFRGLGTPLPRGPARPGRPGLIGSLASWPTYRTAETVGAEWQPKWRLHARTTGDDQSPLSLVPRSERSEMYARGRYLPDLDSAGREAVRVRISAPAPPWTTDGLEGDQRVSPESARWVTRMAASAG